MSEGGLANRSSRRDETGPATRLSNGRRYGATTSAMSEGWWARDTQSGLVSPLLFRVPRVSQYSRRRLEWAMAAIDRAAYPELPEEIQLLWYKDLPP